MLDDKPTFPLGGELDTSTIPLRGGVPTTKLDPRSIESQKMLADRREYYEKVFVQFEIVKGLHHREMSFLTDKKYERSINVRYLLAFSIDYLKKHFDFVSFLSRPLNMYCSVAYLKPTVPVFSHNLKQRLEEEGYKEFNANFLNYIEGYDAFFDFDGKETPEQTVIESKKLKSTLDRYKVPYIIQNSSFKGMHIIIPAQYMPSQPIAQTLNQINDSIIAFRHLYGFKTLDDTVIDPKRLRKMSYSFVCDGSICLPLTDQQLETFKFEICSYQNVMRFVSLKNRGLLLRTHNLDQEQLKQNVIKLFNDFKLKR